MVLFYIFNYIVLYVYLRDHTEEIICSRTAETMNKVILIYSSAHDLKFHPKKFERQHILLYYTFKYLFYKAGAMLSYIEAFIAVSARSHNMSQKNSLPMLPKSNRVNWEEVRRTAM